MTTPAWHIARGDGPLVATAIHAGHDLREEVRALSALDDEARLREEDPHTGEWTSIAPTRVVVSRSRFEVDLNRPREKAVYRVPEDAWGLELWREPLPPGAVSRSLELYDAFYAEMRGLFDSLVESYGFALLLDLHSYNHRRTGSSGDPADPLENPDVNIGTRTLDRDRWAAVVDAFAQELDDVAALDVRENVKFGGGNLALWTHETYPRTVCCLAVEMKKTFMDEWAGTLDADAHERIGSSLASAARAAVDAAEAIVR
jgi:N-formylglutamate amidohydrolase